jgi:glycosyltransferase involved in cell wall biosynthesis
MRHADLLLAQSTGQQELARKHLQRDSVILPNIWSGPYDLSPPDRANETVLWVGSLRGVKRPLMVPELAAALPDIPFAMAGGPVKGDEALHDELVAAVAQTPNLTYLGFVPPNEIDQHYARAALLLCTSKVEGFPNTFLHAWGRGRPVVSTYDPAGLIARENLGIAATSVPEATAAVRELWAAPERCEEIGQRANAYVQAHHHPDVIIEQIERLFNDLTSQGSGIIRSLDA